jgi:hypothetical protein
MTEQHQLLLVLPSTIEIAADGMDVRFTAEATPDDLRRVLQYMSKLKSQYDFVMAQVFRAARARFSDEIVAEQLELSGIDARDIRRPAEMAAGLGELPYRTELSAEQHHIIARAKVDVLKKMYFLDKAVELRLTTRELKASVAAGRILREDDIVGDIDEKETVYEWEERVSDAVDRCLRVIKPLPACNLDRPQCAVMARYLRDVHDEFIEYNIRAQGHAVPNADNITGHE